jgi:hypothetical protein
MWRTRLKNFGIRVLAMLNLQVVPKSSFSPAVGSACQAAGIPPSSGGLHSLDAIATESRPLLSELIKRRLGGEDLPFEREGDVAYLKFDGLDLYFENQTVTGVGYRHQGHLLYVTSMRVVLSTGCNFSINFGPDISGRVQVRIE